MGDHLDFSGSVFNEPFVGKSVVHSSQVTTVTTPRIDDKMYVIMKDMGDLDDNSAHSSTPVGVAMSEERAGRFISNYRIESGFELIFTATSTTGTVLRRDYRYKAVRQYAILRVVPVDVV